MLHLCNVLQFVIDCLDDCPFPEQDSIRYGHQCSLHVVFQLGDKLYSVHKELSEKILADISLVTDELAVEEIRERFDLQWFPVVHIPGRNHEVEQFSFFIADEVKLETEEPAHGALPSLGNALEYLVDVYALVLAHTQRRTVYETDTCAFSQEHLLDEDNHRNGYGALQLHEAVVGDHVREKMAKVLADVFHIEMLQAAVSRIMKKDHYKHDFRLRKRPVAVIFALGRGFYGIFLHHAVKKLAEFICHKENFRNFVLGEHSDYCLYYFMFEHYKGTTIFANHQIFRQLISSNSRYLCCHNNKS